MDAVGAVGARRKYREAPTPNEAGGRTCMLRRAIIPLTCMFYCRVYHPLPALAFVCASYHRSGSVTALPQYTATGTLSTLPPLPFSASVTASVGNGWFDSADNTPTVTAISGCAYPDAWDADNAQIPLSGCLPAATAR